MSDPRILFHLEDVEKRYNGRVIVQVDDLRFRNHEVSLVQGENGSGKSTLLKLVVGVIAPTKGRISRYASRAGLTCGYLAQSGCVYDDLSVRENLLLFSRLFGFRSLPDENVRSILTALALIDHLEKKAGTLSGGFRKLSSLACLLIANPNILVLDEPSSQLDENKVEAVYGQLFARKGALTIIVAEHTARHEAFFDTRYVIRDGVLS